MTPAELVQRLATVGSVEEWVQYVHPEAEFQWLPEGPVTVGLSEVRAYAETMERDPDRPRTAAVSVTEGAHRAVVRGQIRSTRRTAEREFVSVETAAWVVDVQDGLLRRLRAFGDWDEAERAAGFGDGERTREHRLGAGFLAAVGRALGLDAAPIPG